MLDLFISIPLNQKAMSLAMEPVSYISVDCSQEEPHARDLLIV